MAAQQDLESAIAEYANAVEKTKWLLLMFFILKHPLSVQGWPIWPPLPGFSDFNHEPDETDAQIATLSRSQTDGWVTDVQEAIPE